VLLIGAGLLRASFRKLLAVDPGFKSEGVITISTALPQGKYPSEWCTPPWPSWMNCWLKSSALERIRIHKDVRPTGNSWTVFLQATSAQPLRVISVPRLRKSKKCL